MTADEIRVAPAAQHQATMPLSRRAARARLAPSAFSGAPENAPHVDLSPMPASSRRVRRDAAPAIPVPDETVEQIFAESVVIVSTDAPEAGVTESDEPEAVADVESPAVATVEAPSAAQPTPVDDVDPFTAACQAFRSHAAVTNASTEAPAVIGTAAAGGADQQAHLVPLRRRRPAMRKVVAAGASVGVMGLAGLLAISMTLPAEAVAAAQGIQSTSAMSLVTSSSVAEGKDASDEEIQAFVASSDVQNDLLERTEDYSTVSLVDLAAEQGIRYSDTLYSNDPDAAIQWPYVVGVAMSSGYGQRYGRLHAGIDLVPGDGAPIQVIADGTVRIATESGGAYGVTAYVDHIIDGEVVTSHYAHMQYGSLRVKTGDKVKVGDIVGLTGNTGRSYGAHLHFEIIINGSTVNPLPWMQKNAGRHDGVTPVS